MILGMVANAQTRVGEIGVRADCYIPKEFTVTGHPYLVTYQYDDNDNLSSIKVYDDNITLIHTSTSVPSGIEYLTFVDYDAGFYVIEGYVLFTQTMFNTDAEYEYVKITDNHVLEICSENGAVLNTISGENGFGVRYAYLCKLGGKCYLVLQEGDDQWEYGGEHLKFVYYLIGSTTQSVTRVAETPINVFPTVADRSQTITVELGEGNNATEVQVVNAVGQVMKTIAVQPGQREVKLRASDLNSGMHIVGTRSQKGQGACKIIVK